MCSDELEKDSLITEREKLCVSPLLRRCLNFLVIEVIVRYGFQINLIRFERLVYVVEFKQTNKSTATSRTEHESSSWGYGDIDYARYYKYSYDAWYDRYHDQKWIGR